MKETSCNKNKLRIACVDDNPDDLLLLSYMLRKSDTGYETIDKYQSLEELLANDAPSPSVVILDRNLSDVTLTENRIREICSRHKNCAVILYTGFITPSLRSTAAHEGAFAVVEKGTLDVEALNALISAAAIVGPQIGHERHH